MKKTKTLYWVFTGLFGALMLLSAIPDIMNAEDAVKMMHDQMGYPMYLIPFIGIAKTLGVVAILVPGNPRLKEWAYAGLFFDLIGATYSMIALGLPIGNWIFMLLPFSLGALSYFYYHKKQQLAIA